MKNKIGFLSFNICLLALLCAFVSNAQSLDDLRKQYPDEKEVLLNKITEYTITVKDDQPNVESKETEQLAFLSADAMAANSGYSFYHSDFHQVGNYQAYTRTANNKIFKVTDFKTSSDKESFVFYDDVKETTFNFPDAEPGAVGNLEVSLHNTEPHLLSGFYFTTYIPVVNSELKITASADVSLKYYKLGLDTDKISVEIKKERRNNVYTFRYKNCPADRRYGDAPGFAWYSPHVIFCIEKYKDKAGNVVPYLSNLDDLYRFSYHFIKTVNTSISPEIKRVTDSLTANAKTQEEKARNIYSWVQHNIKYVAFEDGFGGFVPREAGLICTRRFGDCKDMASILTEMTKAAGITSYFTWIGTRDLPYSFTSIPLPSVSNHMICTILLNGQFIFLDGTDPTCAFGTPSEGIQGKEAMISINEKEYKILNVPIIDKKQNSLVDSTWLELTPTGIKGKIKQDMHGYFAMNTYGKLMYWDKKDLRDHIKNEFVRGSNKFQLDTFFVARKPTTEEISWSGNFSLPDYAKKIGNEYYLNLNLFKFFENRRIDFPQRKIPIEQNFKYTKKYVTLLKLPDGYKVTYLPEGKTYHNNVWGFDIKYEQKGNLVTFTQEFDNNNLLLTSEQFESWNKVLDNLFPAYKETLSFSTSK
jgi:hypothetical protein